MFIPFSFFSITSDPDKDKFVFTVQTDNTSTGSTNNDQFKLPLVSSFSVVSEVDWGDGTSDIITSYNQPEVTHTYPSAGEYTIKVSNAMHGFRFNNSGDKLKFKNVSNWGIFDISGNASFRGCSNFTSNATDVPIISTTNLSGTFYLCSSFNGYVNDWDVSNVTNLQDCFRNCSVFNQPLNSWDVSNVNSFASTFRSSPQFNQPLNNWTLNTNFVNFQQMFYDADSFNQDLSSWNVSAVISMNSMFRFAGDKNLLNISGWNVSNVTSFYSMFRECNFNDDISSWNVSNAITLREMLFNVDEFDQQIGDWNITGLTNTDGLQDLLRNADGLSTTHYDDLLIKWEAQASSIPTGMIANFGASKFTLGSAADTAKTSLVNTYNWIISDGGGI